MPNIDAILSDFLRLKSACEEMSSKKIVVGIVGEVDQAAQMVQNFIDDNRVKPPSNFSKKTQHTTLYETGTHIRDRIAYKVEE